jgi:hypothetical protein
MEEEPRSVPRTGVYYHVQLRAVPWPGGFRDCCGDPGQPAVDDRDAISAYPGHVALGKP